MPVPAQPKPPQTVPVDASGRRLYGRPLWLTDCFAKNHWFLAKAVM